MYKGEAADFKNICDDIKEELGRLHSGGEIEYDIYSYLFDLVENLQVIYEK